VAKDACLQLLRIDRRHTNPVAKLGQPASSCVGQQQLAVGWASGGKEVAVTQTGLQSACSIGAVQCSAIVAKLQAATNAEDTEHVPQPAEFKSTALW
jgi:hypothetical protein